MSVVYRIATNDAIGSVGNCAYYKAWKRMLQRSLCPKFIQKNPTYIGVSVCESWLTFSNFKRWMESQYWMGMQLDKDLTLRGAKHYSPETCAFVPARINSLLLDCNDRRGEFPLGVYKSTYTPVKPFRARVSTLTGGMRHLGYFPTPEAAHNAWRLGKAQEIANARTWWKSDHTVSKSFNELVAKTLIDIEKELTYGV